MPFSGGSIMPPDDPFGPSGINTRASSPQDSNLANDFFSFGDAAPEPVKDSLEDTTSPRSTKNFKSVPQTKDALGNLFPDIDAIGAGETQHSTSEFDPSKS